MNSILEKGPYQRGIATISMDLNTGKTIIYDESVSDDIRLEAVMSSATIEGAFPLV